jgi:hypothetical protein
MMKAFANHTRRQTTWSLFRNVHLPLLVFQPKALSHVEKTYRVSRTGFFILAAGYTIQGNVFAHTFTTRQLRDTLPGIPTISIYRGINSLLQYGLISSQGTRQSNRRFVLTDKGLGCIQSFVQTYNASIASYGWFLQPKCLR